jgi:hypothetical protein
MAQDSNNKNKKMLVKGAGKFMAKIPGCDELITLGTLNNMRLDIQLDMVDIEGGDTSVPLDTLLRKKTIDITAEDAKFDLNMVRLVLGSKLKEGVTGAPYRIVTDPNLTLADVGDGSGDVQTTLNETPATGTGIPAVQVLMSNGVAVDAANVTVTGTTLKIKAAAGLTAGSKVTAYVPVAVPVDQQSDDGYVWVLEEKHVVTGGTVTLAFASQLVETSSVAVRTLKTNKLLKKVSGTPNALEVQVGADGTITFNADQEGEDVYINYKRYEVVDVLDIATRDFPLTVSVVHDGAFEQKDGSIQAFQIELYTCRVKSNFVLDAQRQQASTHSVTLTVIDPERADGKLGTIKRYEVANTNLSDIC